MFPTNSFVFASTLKIRAKTQSSAIILRALITYSPDICPFHFQSTITVSSFNLSFPIRTTSWYISIISQFFIGIRIRDSGIHIFMAKFLCAYLSFAGIKYGKKNSGLNKDSINLWSSIQPCPLACTSISSFVIKFISLKIKLFIMVFTAHSFHGIGVADINIVSHFLSCKKLCSFLDILVSAANSSP